MKKLIMLFAAIGLSGCMATMPKPKQPDLSGIYDGIWSLQLAMKNEYQRKGAGNFHCNVGSGNLVMFVDKGRVGTMQYGADAGMIDSQGRLYLRQLTGTFNSYFNANPDRDLVVHGKLDIERGEGYYIQAISGTDDGCKGDFTATRRDVVSTMYELPNSFAVPTSLTRDGQPLKGELWTRPFGGKKASWMVFKSSDDQLICRGYWSKSAKRDLKGRWYLYCDDQQLLKGSWNKRASTWTAEGLDNAGNGVLLSGRLNNKHQKNMPSNFGNKAGNPGGYSVEIIRCQIGKQSPFTTSSLSCNQEGGRIVKDDAAS